MVQSARKHQASKLFSACNFAQLEPVASAGSVKHGVLRYIPRVFRRSKRTAIKAVRLTPAEVRAVTCILDSADLTFSDYVRMLIRRDRRKHKRRK